MSKPIDNESPTRVVLYTPDPTQQQDANDVDAGNPLPVVGGSVLLTGIPLGLVKAIDLTYTAGNLVGLSYRNAANAEIGKLVLTYTTGNLTRIERTVP
jgi:hypothetical protein